MDWPRAPRTSWSLEAMGISSSIVGCFVVNFDHGQDWKNLNSI